MKRKRKARSLCVCETLLTGSASLTEVVCVCDNNVCVCVTTMCVCVCV